MGDDPLDDALTALFDGRERAEFTLDGFDAAQAARITAAAVARGYALRKTEAVARDSYRMVFERDEPAEAGHGAGAAEAGAVSEPRDAGAASAPEAARATSEPVEGGTVSEPVSARATSGPAGAGATSARRDAGAFERYGVKGTAAAIGLLSCACWVLAWVKRDTIGIARSFVFLGILLTVATALTPQFLRNWAPGKGGSKDAEGPSRRR